MIDVWPKQNAVAWNVTVRKSLVLDKTNLEFMSQLVDQMYPNEKNTFWLTPSGCPTDSGKHVMAKFKVILKYLLVAI